MIVTETTPQLDTIPLVDVAWQHRQVRAQIDAAWEHHVTDPTCDGAHFCKKLEAEFRAYFGEGTYAVSVQSGLAAQFLALKAIGVGAGDEVITVPNSDLATTGAISHTGARPVLVDVDATHNLDPIKIEAAITPRTRAILPVHLYGRPAEMEAICAIARKHNLWVVEDATLALGATYHGQKAGLLGDAAFFSFAPRKVLGGLGNGGMVVTRSEEVARHVGLLKGYGLDPANGERPIAERHQFSKLSHLVEGHNLKMDGLNAAVVSAKFAHVEAWNALRNDIAQRYSAAFVALEGVDVPILPVYICHGWRNYVVTVPEGQRDAMRESMRLHGITTSTLYAPPVHLQPVYAEMKLGEGSFPVAEALSRQVICLPIYPGMSEEQVERVIAAFKSSFFATQAS
ncbi:erythromycin biosynthesis sensory transduction protein eryC1 [bacterium]|nr:erythromycin biosynthesis sensory transduction protein eryC1 [bacterium]